MLARAWASQKTYFGGVAALPGNGATLLIGLFQLPPLMLGACPLVKTMPSERTQNTSMRIVNLTEWR